jgi:hypothetical protein
VSHDLARGGFSRGNLRRLNVTRRPS